MLFIRRWQARTDMMELCLESGREGGRVLGVGLVLERTSRGRWCEEKGRGG